MTEMCFGCCGEATRHPMVAVMADGESFQAVPICEACWRDPEHRMRTLKAHFFPRAQAMQAVALAGSSTLGG